jgi:polyisoprenoid-binding protein YceI
VRDAVAPFALHRALAAVAGGSGAAEFEVDRSHLTVYFAVSHFDISFVRAASAGSTPRRNTIRRRERNCSRYRGCRLDRHRQRDARQRAPLAAIPDVGNNPEIRFVSERFVFEGNALVAVDGRLWLHGIQQPLRLNVERFVCKEVRAGIVRRHVCGGAFRAAFRRSTFGLTQFLPEVGDEVQLAISVEGTRR